MIKKVKKVKILNFPKKEHTFSDADLINASCLAEKLGVSSAAITKAVKSGRLDTFENSKGKPLFAREYSAKQFLTKKDRSKVTTPTKAQKAAGFTNSTAQASAAIPGAENPQMMQRMQERIGENLSQMRDWKSMFEDLDVDLETSRALKETQMARLATLKAEEMEGRLVDKHLAFQKCFKATNEIQEKLTSIYSKIAPIIVGELTDIAVNAGADGAILSNAKSAMEHAAGEKIRVAIIDTLRELVDKMSNEEKFYG